MPVSKKVDAEERRQGKRFELSISEIRALNIHNYPVRRGKHFVARGENPNKDKQGNPKPYRFLDGTQEAPKGFGFYVGARGATYEVSRRGPKGFVRFSLGSVNDMGLEEAHELAREKIKTLMATGLNPKRVEAAKAVQAEIVNISVEECFGHYIKDLEWREARGQIKGTSVQGVKDSLARLQRPEVGFAKRRVKELIRNDQLVLDAFEAVRLSAMKRSNRIPTALKERLAAVGDWSTLSLAELEKIGITGKYVQRVKAAGLAAAEHTMGDAMRAVGMVVDQEIKTAAAMGRQPELFVNPLRILLEKKAFRAPRELRKHYAKAQVRNPLGEDDGTLANVLKSILGRRNEQNGHNRSAADYLLLTLLFGSRRIESARLKWFDRCTKSEIVQEHVSWVWLTNDETEKNPHTKRAGSQVYFHDTKTGEERLIPVSYFAKRILQNRIAERDEQEAALPGLIQDAERKLRATKKATSDYRKIGKAQRDLEIMQSKAERLSWVFPARSHKAKAGHYTDSKSILRNVQRDAGLIDLDKEIDIGLTNHDLRRTLGRFAAALYRGKIVSQILHHRVPDESGDQMSEVSQIYTEQEWSKLQEAFANIEEKIIATSPRVWNLLKGPDKPILDVANDPPITIFASRKTVDAGNDED